MRKHEDNLVKFFALEYVVQVCGIHAELNLPIVVQKLIHVVLGQVRDGLIFETGADNGAWTQHRLFLKQRSVRFKVRSLFDSLPEAIQGKPN